MGTPGVRGVPGVAGQKGEPGAAGPLGPKGERVRFTHNPNNTHINIMFSCHAIFLYANELL